jgi:hypothetical protein
MTITCPTPEDRDPLKETIAIYTTLDSNDEIQEHTLSPNDLIKASLKLLRRLSYYYGNPTHQITETDSEYYQVKASLEFLLRMQLRTRNIVRGAK